MPTEQNFWLNEDIEVNSGHHRKFYVASSLKEYRKHCPMCNFDCVKVIETDCINDGSVNGVEIKQCIEDICMVGGDEPTLKKTITVRFQG